MEVAAITTPKAGADGYLVDVTNRKSLCLCVFGVLVVACVASTRGADLGMMSLVCFCNSAVTDVVFVSRRIRDSVFSLS